MLTLNTKLSYEKCKHFNILDIIKTITKTSISNQTRQFSTEKEKY